MAVTSIWAVKNRMDIVLNYIENPEKTTHRPEEAPDANAAMKHIRDVLGYACNEDKTDKMMYVTGVNCDPDTALEEFIEVKQRWHKEGGRLAYHGYQSFREGPGEITAEEAHEIGVELAKELWGDRFQVVVATHLNTGHYHNHFVLNSVSFADGYKYVRFNSDYRHMQEVSDNLCRQRGLNVIMNPSTTKGKTYDEWIEPYLVSNTLELLDKEIPRLKPKIKSVHLCFSTDPFMLGYDEITQMSLAAIKKLNESGIKCVVLTKGILPVELASFSKDNKYGITLISLDETYREKIEPFAAPYQKRIEALKKFCHERIMAYYEKNNMEEEKKVTEGLKGACSWDEFVKMKKQMHSNLNMQKSNLENLKGIVTTKTTIQTKKSFEEKIPDIAKDIVENTYNLDENTLNQFRGLFEDKFGCKPEEYAKHKS